MRASAAPSFVGTRRLTGLAVRRDRYRLTVWCIGLSFFVGATTAMFGRSLASTADLVRETRLVSENAGMRLLGITSGPSVGGYMLHREFVTVAALAALMSTFTVVRHTRQDEELGRAEMVASTVVGRHAGLAAAAVVAVAADLVLAVLVAVAVAVAGQPVAGAILTGASVAAVGVAWVGVAAVTCQLSSTTRGATGGAVGALGVAFGVSGVGNMLGTVDASGMRVTSTWVTWLSPVGWGQQTRPFGDAHWWPLLLAVALGVLLSAVAVVLAARRDVGRGIWPPRHGRPAAARSLLSPTGLAVRLQRGVLLGWAVALAMFGLIFGSLTEQIQDLQGSSRDWWVQAGGSERVVDAYQTSIMQMAGMFVAVYLVQVLLRMRVDENGGTAEPVLATSVTRARWLGSHLGGGAVGAVVLLGVFAGSMGLTAGQVLGDTGTQVRDLAVSGLVQLPGIFVVGAAVTVLVGVTPRWSATASWALLLASLVVGPMFAAGLDLPVWLRDLSPFTHTPKAPATPVSAEPLLALTAGGVCLAAVALVVLRRRDLVLPA